MVTVKYGTVSKPVNSLQAMVTSIVWSVLLLLCCSLMGNISNTVNSIRPKGEESLNKGEVLFLTEWLDKMITGVIFWSKRKTDSHGSPGDNPVVTKLSEVPGQSAAENQPQIPPGQTLQAAQGQTAVTNLPGKIQNSPGQAMVMYPPGQPVQNTTGQPVQMWQVDAID